MLYKVRSTKVQMYIYLAFILLHVKDYICLYYDECSKTNTLIIDLTDLSTIKTTPSFLGCLRSKIKRNTFHYLVKNNQHPDLAYKTSSQYENP